MSDRDDLMETFDPVDRHEPETRRRREEASPAVRPDYEERLDGSAGASAPERAAIDLDGDDELRRALEETFLVELTELLAGLSDRLARMADPAQQAELCAELGRVFHTIKGSAATVGRDDLSELGRRLQETVEGATEGAPHLPLAPELVAAIEAPLGELFLAAGLEPPSRALETLAEVARASLVDDDAPGDATALADASALGNAAPPAVDDRLAADAASPPDSEAASPGAAEPPAVEPEMMEAFLLDARVALDASESALLALERDPSDGRQLRILFRQLHTLKGAAAAIGLTRITDQLHAGETLLESIIEGAARHDPAALLELLLELLDSVAGLVAEARGLPHEHRVLADVASRVYDVLAGDAVAAGAAPASLAAAGAPAPAAPSAALSGRPGPAPLPERSALPAQPVADPESAVVRVHASRLDLLMNRVSELVVSRTRMEDTMGAVHELKHKLGGGRLRLQEMTEGLRSFEHVTADSPPPRDTAAAERVPSPLDFSDLEFDKYDDFHLLARSLVELAADAGEIVEQLAGLTETLAEETRQISKVTSSLQRTITGMRLLSLDTLFRRLQRPAREAARQAGKQVDLVCVGSDVQVDRALIESLYGPLLHLLRNAVSHGIEPLVERRAAGKPDVGLVEIRVVQRHGSVEVSLRDDGSGLDFAAIRAKAESLGLVEPGAPVAREELAELVFRPGFSTRNRADDLSGRGIGMDVVAGAVEQLRGSVSVESLDGKGAQFRITLPLTAAIDQVLLLRAGPEVYAVSQGPVETALNIESEHLASDPGGLRLRIGNEAVPAIALAALTGAASRGAPGTAVVLRVGERRLALLVDRIEAQREAVLRPLNRLFAGHPFVSSATFSGDGQVIFVIDAARLESWVAPSLATAAGAAPAPCAADATRPEAGRPEAGGDEAIVLWADDSISVRKLAAHFVTAEGWTSRTAVDGRDALEKLRSGSFRVLVTDLEMPRMDGYELLREIRSDPHLKDLPVVVCSSRSSEKHRRAARDAGATGYLVKPFTREALAEALRGLAG